MKQSVQTLSQKKLRGEKITMVTAYDYSMAKLADGCGVDSILVGDSLGMVMLGYDTTLPVTMDDMIHHTRAVTRGSQNAFVVADLPFLSYQTGVRDAVCNAGRLMKEGRPHAVKLEGGTTISKEIEAIVRAGIPVVGHIGMTPQSVHSFGGFKVQGKDYARASEVLRDAIAVERAGACAVVLECVPTPLAQLITETLSIPTIGIGAGNVCDGQVLVCNDLLGMFEDFTPKFVKRFASIGEGVREGFAQYCEAVRSGSFPSVEHEFSMDSELIAMLRRDRDNGNLA